VKHNKNLKFRPNRRTETEHNRQEILLFLQTSCLFLRTRSHLLDHIRAEGHLSVFKTNMIKKLRKNTATHCEALFNKGLNTKDIKKPMRLS